MPTRLLTSIPYIIAFAILLFMNPISIEIKFLAADKHQMLEKASVFSNRSLDDEVTQLFEEIDCDRPRSIEEEMICETEQEIFYIEEIVKELDCKYPVNMEEKTVGQENKIEE